MLKEKIENKIVVFIPLFSMRNRKTGIYELEHDGNFARIKSLLKTSNPRYAYILTPQNAEYNALNMKNVQCIRTNIYKENAAATRSNVDAFSEVERLIKIITPDVIISEPNALTIQLSKTNWKDKLVYWCVASKTSQGTPWFVKDWSEADFNLAQEVETACVTIPQIEYLKGKSYLESSFYAPKVFDYKTIFFPFRLTDENYHAKDFANAIIKLAHDDDLPAFKVLYTDINNSGIFDNFNTTHLFKKISSDHDVYLQVLKGRPIIPYLERDAILEHISIHEFIYYHCELIMLTQRHKRAYSNIIYIETIDGLYEALRASLLKGE